MQSVRNFFTMRELRALVLAVYAFASIVPAFAQVSPGAPTKAVPATAPAAKAVADPAAGKDVHRLALVIGNSAYPSSALRNPVNDSRAMAQVLKAMGFEVIARENLNVGDFRAIIREFARRAEAEEGVALFYYAGHAVSLYGRNFLLPVDIRPTDEEAIKDDSIDVDEAVLQRLERSKKQVRLLILDSCRDNPFRRAGTRSVSPGLAEMGKGEGTLIAFSTAPGRVAEDGEGQNSLFTGFLVRELERGTDIESVFQSVRFAVAEATGRRQVPWVNTSLLNRVYLKPGGPDPAPSTSVPDDNRAAAEEQARIDAAIAASERRREAERKRLEEARARDKADVDARLAAIQDEQNRDRRAREILEQQQRRQLDDLAAKFADMRRVMVDTEQIARARALTTDESDRAAAALAEADALQRRAAAEARVLQDQLNAGRNRDTERNDQIAALAAQAERLSVPIAPQRARIAADGTVLARGVALPKDVQLQPVVAETPAQCGAFQGAWSGRWDGLRTVELWIERVDRDCGASVVYGRGGQSINAEPPQHQRARGKVTGGELRVALADGAVIAARAVSQNRLAATWTREGRTVKADLTRIDNDPLRATAVFAMEDADFGASPTRYLETPSPTKPLPKSVPGVTTVTTLELKQLLDTQPGVVLVDAYSEGAHMSLTGALWRPDIGVPRPGAFPLADIRKAMADATNRNLERPIVVFERSSTWGWYGYNAALRLLGMGYTNVYWYRGGIDAWFDAGYAMARLTAPTMVAR